MTYVMTHEECEEQVRLYMDVFRHEIPEVLLDYWRNHPPDRCYCAWHKNDMMRDLAYECAFNPEFTIETRFHWYVIYSYELRKVFDHA